MWNPIMIIIIVIVAIDTTIPLWLSSRLLVSLSLLLLLLSCMYVGLCITEYFVDFYENMCKDKCMNIYAYAHICKQTSTFTPVDMNGKNNNTTHHPWLKDFPIPQYQCRSLYPSIRCGTRDERALSQRESAVEYHSVYGGRPHVRTKARYW